MYRILGSLHWDQISAWPQLEAAITALDSEQMRGEAFEEFCHAFFKLQSQLYQSKNVWRFRNVPPAVLERLGTSIKQDKGIDGVLLHADETITAYQAKFRINRASTPSQREVSTFYMVSDRADYRLIISNVDDLPVVVKERKDHGQILVDKLLELDSAFFLQLADLARGARASDRPALAPRPYQVEALSSIVEGLNAAGRGQAILACGVGKTLIGKWVCDDLECETALVMVPSLALIRQTIGEWHHANSKPFRYLCVCSDSTVDAQADDSWVVNSSDLDCRVTTRALDVISFLRSTVPTTRVIFCTYQSGEVLAIALKSEELTEFSFDLAICDEAHRLAGLTTKIFNHVLSDDSIRARRRLFMTATPKILKPRLKDSAEEDQAEVFSMDDENTFGRVLFRFGFKRAIEEKIICDYQIVVIGVSEEETKLVAPGSEHLKATDSGRWNIEGLAQRIALGKAISSYGIEKIFSFHSRVEAASRFVDDQLPDSFTSLMKQLSPETDFLATHISGAMPAGLRARKLRDFESAIRGVIANAKCLGEGVNVPVVDGIFFSDPKESVIEIIQATGRALRRKANKKTAYVMIPVLIRTGEDPAGVLRSSRFDTIWKVLSAMSSQDDRLQAAMDEAAVSRGGSADSIAPQNNARGVLGAPDYRTVLMGFPTNLPLSEYQRLFTLEAVEKTGDRWFVRFGALKRYVETYGEEPKKETEFEGITLGNWLMKQRADLKTHKLAPDRVKLIASLGISLSDGRPAQWERQLIACKAFFEISHRLPHSQERSANGMKIGEWIAHQRKAFKSGNLSKEKIERLEQMLGPILNPVGDRWVRNFEAYRNYVEKTGEQPARRTVYNGVNIGVWYLYQRKNFQRLSESQLNSLKALGMEAGTITKQGKFDAKRLYLEFRKSLAALGTKTRQLRLGKDLRNEFSLQTDAHWIEYLEVLNRVLTRKPFFQGDYRRFHEISAWLKYQFALYLDNELSSNRQEHFEKTIVNLSEKYESCKNSPAASRPKTDAPKSDSNTVSFASQTDEARRPKTDDTKSDSITVSFADQTDEDWFQYYVWCKEIGNSGTRILAGVPTQKIQDIKAWLRTQHELQRDSKLPEFRQRFLKNLSNLEWS